MVSAQSITFTNANPPVTIELESTGFGDPNGTGNWVARCAPTAAGCQRLSQGGGTTTAITSLVVTNPPPYPAGTPIPVSAQVVDAAVCTRDAFIVPDVGQPVGTSLPSWTGSFIPSAPTATVVQNVTLPQASTAYRLRLTCFGSGGSATRTVDITTAAGVTPTPGCPTGPTAPYTTTSAGSATTRVIRGPGGSTLPIRNINGWEELFSLQGSNLNPFPSTGLSGVLLEPPNTVRILRFVVPSEFPPPFAFRITFNSWPNGFDLARDAYVSVSTCPGDFRIPSGGQAGSTTDPTFAEGCRNWRDEAFSWIADGGVNNINWTDASTPSSAARCMLERGRTYYLNMYMVKPNPNRTLDDFGNEPFGVCGFTNPCGFFTNAN
jgi:hypothetical protein